MRLTLLLQPTARWVTAPHRCHPEHLAQLDARLDFHLQQSRSTLRAQASRSLTKHVKCALVDRVYCGIRKVK